MCYTFLVALSGVTALVVHETSAATGLMKGSLGDFRENKKEKKQINIKNRNVAKKERSSAAVDEQFLSNLVQLGKIVLPSWR